MSGASQPGVVAVVAHPDDAELLCFGTLMHFVAQGADVSVVVVTDGTGGVSIVDVEAGRSLEQNERWKETLDAFEGTGVSVECLGIPDGALTYDRELISAIEAILVAKRSEVVVTHTPNAGTDHQDHGVVGRATANACTRVPALRWLLHGEPHAPRSRFAPSVFVDVTEHLEAKERALKAHRSQAGRWYLSDDYTRQRASNAAWRASSRLAADGRLFEAFECSVMVIGSPGAAASGALS